MSDVLFAVLLALHVGGMVSWLGTAGVMTFVIVPALGRLEPAVRAAASRAIFAPVGMAIALEAVVGGVGGLGLLVEYRSTFSPSETPLLMAGAGLGFVAFLIMAVHGVTMTRRARAPGGPAPTPAWAKALPLVGLLLLVVTFVVMIAAVTAT